LSALSSLQAKHAQAQATNQSQEGQRADFAPSLEELTAEAKAILPDGVELLEEDFDNAIGEAYVFLSFRPSPSSFFPCCRSSLAPLKINHPFVFIYPRVSSVMLGNLTTDAYYLPRSLINSARSPTADLPNTAALLGGVVAQEVIKMITKQYVPIDGYCTIDLVETWTGVL
jgi:hypothetical protein